MKPDSGIPGRLIITIKLRRRQSFTPRIRRGRAETNVFSLSQNAPGDISLPRPNVNYNHVTIKIKSHPMAVVVVVIVVAVALAVVVEKQVL